MCFWKKTRLIFESFALDIPRAQRYFLFPRIDMRKESRAGKSGELQIYKIIKFHKCAAGLLSTIKRLISFCRVRKIPRARKNARGIFINFAP